MKYIILFLFLIGSIQAQPTLANSDDIIAAKDRANHTGTQAIETIEGLQSSINGNVYASTGTMGALKTMMDAKRSVGIAICGDSTGNGLGEWVDIFTQSLAADYPDFSVNHQVYSGSAWSTLWSYDAGAGERGWHFPSSGTIYEVGLSQSDFSPPQSDDFSVELKVKVEDFAILNQATARIWNSFGGSDSDRLFTVTIAAAKTLYFEHWNNSGTHIYKGASTAALPYNNGDTFWIRVELDGDNGSGNHTCKYYYRTNDLDSWTQLGSTYTTAGTAPMRQLDPNSILSYAAILPNPGITIYKFRIFDTIDQTKGPVAMLPVDHFDKGSSANTAELVGSPVLTVRNCSVSGYGVRNYLDPTQPGYVALSTIFKDKTEGVVLDFVSLGHNQWAGVQYAMVGDFVRGVDEIFEFLETSFPKSSRVYIAQNPKNHPGIEPANERHALGASRLLLRAKQGGFSSLNIFQAFKDSAIPLATLVNTTPGDYQHPTSEGSALWAEILMDAFNSNSL